MGFSKHFLTIINLVTLLLSIPIFSAGIWLATRHHSDCYQFLQGPVIAVGLLIFFISLAGFVGAFSRTPWFLWFYLFAMSLLIILLLCFTIFAFAVTNKGVGETLSGKGYKDYRLGDYSTWLQRRVNDPKDWNKIRSCLQDAHVCSGLEVYKLATDFNNAQLTPLQSGCCKPPTVCNYLFLNATYWTRPLNEEADPDCQIYSYVQNELCFNCSSCRAGVLAKVKHDWHKVAAVNIAMFIFLMLVYAAACRTFHRAHKEGKYTSYSKEGTM